MTTKAAIYVRISSDSEHLRLGVTRQLKDCSRICEEEQWAVVGPYVDNDKTAADPNKPRPEYERMMVDIRMSLIDVVVVAVSDRLHRQPMELEIFISDCKAAGMTRLRTDRRREYDLTDYEDVRDIRKETIDAAYEVDRLSARIKRAKTDKAERGEWSGGGTRPFGYGANPIDDSAEAKAEARNHINERNDYEAALIREAAAHVIAGGSLYSIKKKWIEEDVPTITGTRWSVTAIKQTLIRPRTAGLRQHRGEILEGVKTEWPPILDRTTWEQVRTILCHPGRRQRPPSRSYPLRGLLRCSGCGSVLASMPRKGRRLYGCRKDTGGCGHVMITGDHIERYIYTIALPLADHPDLRDIIRAEEASLFNEAQRLVSDRVKDEEALRTLQDDFDDGMTDRASFLRRSSRLHDRIDLVTSQLAGIRGQSALDRLGGDVQRNWEAFTPDDKRMILQSVVETIVVSPAVRRGSNIFDASRVNIKLRFAALAKIQELDWGTHDRHGNPFLDPDGRPLMYTAFSVKDGVLGSATRPTSELKRAARHSEQPA